MYGGGYKGYSHHSERRFPFWTFRALGWTLILLGVASFCLGLTDTAYTATKYEDDDCEDNDYMSEGWTEDPCGHDDHVFAYVSAAIWGSIFVIITGIIGARFSKWNCKHLRFQRDLFAVMAGVAATLFVPVMIAMHALELKFAKDMGAFYYQDDDLKTRDEVKFSIPVVILIVAGIEWIICLVIFIMCCYCAPVRDEESLTVPMRVHSPMVSSRPSSYYSPAYTLPMAAPVSSPYVVPMVARPASIPYVVQPSRMVQPRATSMITEGPYGGAIVPYRAHSYVSRGGQAASLATTYGRPPGSVQLPPVVTPVAMEMPHGRAFYTGTLFNDYDIGSGHGQFVPRTEEFLRDDDVYYPYN